MKPQLIRSNIFDFLPIKPRQPWICLSIVLSWTLLSSTSYIWGVFWFIHLNSLEPMFFRVWENQGIQTGFRTAFQQAEKTEE